MGLTADLLSEVKGILETNWTVRDGQGVPDPNDPNIKLKNDGVNIDATVLYADIDGSTSMVDSRKPHFAAEVYQSYLVCAARIVKAEGGHVTAYDGDRIMAVFHGQYKNTSAVTAGLKIRYAVDKVINPAIKGQYPDSQFELKQVVGIDTSKILVARIGVRKDNDLVWVGPAANWAAKFSGLSEQPYSTFISKAVYDGMADSVKYLSGIPMWESRTWKERSIYRSNYMWNLG